VRIYTGVTGSSSHGLAIRPCDVLPSLFVDVSLRQAKIDYKALFLGIRCTHQEIIWLNVSMQELIIMQNLNKRQQLVGKHTRSLNGELLFASLEKSFQRLAEKRHDQNAIVALHTVPVYCRHPSCINSV
jgi:hypothetical protein